jgi:uncharacterized protein YqgC (DUF456 family)
MEIAVAVLGALLLVIALAICWCLTLVGLPGNWLMVASAAIYALLLPPSWRTDIGWWTVALLAVLAVLGEVIEFAAGAWGAARAGGSKRAAVLALLGSIAGGLVGVVVGLPIPVVGPLIAAVLFAACGATAGAVVGETWKGRGLDEGLQVGKSAFWGRLLGTVGKFIVGSVMIVTAVVALLM